MGDSGLVTGAEPAPVFRRFPWLQLVFCLACLSTTAWTWMMAPPPRPVAPNEDIQEMEGQYVTMEVEPWMKDSFSNAFVREHVFPDGPRYGYVFLDKPPPEWSNRVAGRVRRFRYYPDVPELLLGTCVHFGDGFVLHLSAKPDDGWHPAAVPGLAVGAMGCFIFGLCLRRWLKSRREAA
ncbi:MAG: hypothetical protein ACYS9X_31800 [Planctomycetota bacterium]